MEKRYLNTIYKSSGIHKSSIDTERILKEEVTDQAFIIVCEIDDNNIVLVLCTKRIVPQSNINNLKYMIGEAILLLFN